MDTIREIISSIYGVLITLRQTISFWDIVDMLVITYLIYRILTLMRKTNAGSVIKGIIFILVIAGLANVFNLQVVTYLLDQMMQMGIVVLVVLFQPELRKLFEQVGSSKLNVFFRKRAKDEHVEACINSVVDACFAMAKTQTGAIVVFEREVGLNDYVSTGIRMDAIVSPELIQNIFFENSPLHDGAALIRDGKLLAASCMLPLSQNITLSRDLGMRHRAAIGISERSDAVIIIVSEQSSAISVAIDGMLKRHLSKDTVGVLLKNELLQKGTNANKKASKKNKKEGKENNA
jgi:diadenylate cyclase